MSYPLWDNVRMNILETIVIVLGGTAAIGGVWSLTMLCVGARTLRREKARRLPIRDLLH